jgi:hypothetical protein
MPIVNGVWVEELAAPQAQPARGRDINNMVRDMLAANPAPALRRPVAPRPASVPVPKLLKQFVDSGADFEGSQWTSAKVFEALAIEGWRVREIDEVIRVGDILCLNDIAGGSSSFEQIQGWKDVTITQEQVDLHNFAVYTLEGAGRRRRKQTFEKTTKDFKDIYSVPEGLQLRLPEDMKEAERFFLCPVLPTEVMIDGKIRKSYYPVLTRLQNKQFRIAFSRIFVDFAKRHAKNHIRELIPGRGHGIRQERGVSIKKLIPVPVPFIEKMKNRALTPDQFRYDKAIGIEIETCSPLTEDAAQAKMPSWVRSGRDGSIKPPPGHHQVEFRMLIKRSEAEDRLKKAINAINAIGCRVNPTCGLHVHFDMRGRSEADVLKIAERLAKWLKVLKELVPASRRNCEQYCKLDFAPNDRYCAVNFMAFKKYGTLEVRLHSGTIDYIKIINWIRLMDTLMNTKVTPLPNTSTLDALKMLDLTDEQRTFWLKRHHQLNPGMYPNPITDLNFLDKPNEEESNA